VVYVMSLELIARSVAHSQSTRMILDNMTSSAKKPLLIDSSDNDKNIPKERSSTCQGKYFPEERASITRRSTAIVHRYRTPLGSLSLRDVSMSTTFGSEETNANPVICS